MFESDLVEKFSRIHPATPFVAWLPVAAFFFARGPVMGKLGWIQAMGLFAAGVLAWTFAEYTLHRFVFHWTNETNWGRRVHFVLHGVHHDFPTDKQRLVMPLGASIPLAIVFYSLFYVTMGSSVGDPFFGGFVVGYLGYDGTHYALHHFHFRSKWARALKHHHMLHHHADHSGGFGVSTPLWDIIFRTMPKVAPRTIRVVEAAAVTSNET